jgi:hypothetical protein
MNCRHAAGLGLLGWYLMVPLPPRRRGPPSWGDYFADLFRRTNSFSDWKIVESFDSATDCEKADPPLRVLSSRPRPGGVAGRAGVSLGHPAPTGSRFATSALTDPLARSPLTSRPALPNSLREPSTCPPRGAS